MGNDDELDLLLGLSLWAEGVGVATTTNGPSCPSVEVVVRVEGWIPRSKVEQQPRSSGMAIRISISTHFHKIDLVL